MRLCFQDSAALANQGMSGVAQHFMPYLQFLYAFSEAAPSRGACFFKAQEEACRLLLLGNITGSWTIQSDALHLRRFEGIRAWRKLGNEARTSNKKRKICISWATCARSGIGAAGEGWAMAGHEGEEYLPYATHALQISTKSTRIGPLQASFLMNSGCRRIPCNTGLLVLTSSMVRNVSTGNSAKSTICV